MIRLQGGLQITRQRFGVRQSLPLSKRPKAVRSTALHDALATNLALGQALGKDYGKLLTDNDSLKQSTSSEIHPHCHLCSSFNGRLCLPSCQDYRPKRSIEYGACEA